MSLHQDDTGRADDYDAGRIAGMKAGRAEGYREGLEAAAKCAESIDHGHMTAQGDHSKPEYVAAAIRALMTKEQP